MSARAPPRRKKKARGSARSPRPAASGVNTTSDSDSDASVEADEPELAIVRHDAAQEKSLYGGIVPDDEDPLELSDEQLYARTVNSVAPRSKTTYASYQNTVTNRGFAWTFRGVCIFISSVRRTALAIANSSIACIISAATRTSRDGVPF